MNKQEEKVSFIWTILLGITAWSLPVGERMRTTVTTGRIFDGRERSGRNGLA